MARLLLGVAAKHAATSWVDTVNGSPGLVFEADGGHTHAPTVMIAERDADLIRASNHEPRLRIADTA